MTTDPQSFETDRAHRRVGRALDRLGRFQLANMIRVRIEREKLRLAFVLLLSAILWLLLFGFFYEAFRFLTLNRFVTMPLMEILFGLFFVSLTGMLFFSSGILLYSGLFATSESIFLLSKPVPDDRIFAHKFKETLFISSWAFVLLGSPLMLAYGIMFAVPWTFYPLSAVYFLSFALLPVSLGGLACLAVTILSPRRRNEVLLYLLIITAITVIAGLVKTWLSARGTLFTLSWLDSLLSQLMVIQSPLIPSWWVSHGLILASREDGLPKSLPYLGVLLSNGLFFYLLASFCYRRFYRLAYDRVHSANYGSTARVKQRRQQSRSFNTRRGFSGWVPFIPTRIQMIIRKDILTFFRDPAQWLQVLVFSGLLLLYFITLSRMNFYAHHPYWRNMVGFFNLCVLGLILSTYTSRFVFPLLSLESQKFWILGLSPLSRGDILWSKFFFSVVGTGSLTLILTCVSVVMLGLDWKLAAIQLYATLLICSGVSGIAVGLGAIFPDMRQSDPSRIATGFGGTLNLVASLLYLLLMIFLLALPCHYFSITQAIASGYTDIATLGMQIGIDEETFAWAFGASLAGSFVLAACATILPLHLGLRAFEKQEF